MRRYVVQALEEAGYKAVTSMITAEFKTATSERRYEDHHAYCLLYTNGICGLCIDRCPVGAISREGHDKETCSRHVNATSEYVRSNYGFEGYGYGLFQTGVPCESRIPPGLEM